ncbi:MAG TPA: hypothetical protein VGB32_05305 [Candidatus Bathyarchaeia archaeon]
MSGLGDDLKELNRKLEAMMNRLDHLEAILTESRQYPEMAQLMGDLRVGASLYSEPLKLIQRLISVRRHLGRGEEHRDEVSRIIMNALALKGPMNVSQLTREVQRERGKGSRVTVRNKLHELEAEGVVERGEDHSYRLAE